MEKKIYNDNNNNYYENSDSKKSNWNIKKHHEINHNSNNKDYRNIFRKQELLVHIVTKIFLNFKCLTQVTLVICDFMYVGNIGKQIAQVEYS